MRLIWVALAAASAATAMGATIVVPIDQATIQQAVDVAAPGDTIQVRPGTYQESVRIGAGQTGLTIEAAEPTDPPVIQGTQNKSADGIRDDMVDGVTFRNLRIVGAYDGVRLNDVTGATLVGLDVENSALGIRVNHGQNTLIDQCTVIGTRVEQGILIASAPGALVVDSVVGDTAREGIRVVGSPGVVLDGDQVTGSRAADGIGVDGSPGGTVSECTASASYHDGIRVAGSVGLVLSNNTALDNLSVGLSITDSLPFQFVADVMADGNSASGNHQADIVVAGGSCGSRCPATTTTTSSTVVPTSTTFFSSTSTSSSTTTSSLPGTASLWRFYVQIAVGSGAPVSVDVPRRSDDAPIEVPIPAALIPDFPVGKRVTGSEIAVLGEDVLNPLTDSVKAYLVDHPAEYPDLTGFVGLQWATQVSS
jgi:parallel beta-helix repeat protein